MYIFFFFFQYLVQHHNNYKCYPKNHSEIPHGLKLPTSQLSLSYIVAIRYIHIHIYIYIYKHEFPNLTTLYITFKNLEKKESRIRTMSSQKIEETLEKQSERVRHWIRMKMGRSRKCTSSLRRASDSDAPVMDTNVSIASCDGLAIAVDLRKLQTQRERERGCVLGREREKRKVCVNSGTFGLTK